MKSRTIFSVMFLFFLSLPSVSLYATNRSVFVFTPKSSHAEKLIHLLQTYRDIQVSYSPSSCTLLVCGSIKGVNHCIKYTKRKNIIAFDVTKKLNNYKIIVHILTFIDVKHILKLFGITTLRKICVLSEYKQQHDPHINFYHIESVNDILQISENIFFNCDTIIVLPIKDVSDNIFVIRYLIQQSLVANKTLIYYTTNDNLPPFPNVYFYSIDYDQYLRKVAEIVYKVLNGKKVPTTVPLHINELKRTP